MINWAVNTTNFKDIILENIFGLRYEVVHSTTNSDFPLRTIFFPKKIDQTSSYFVEKIEIRRNYALDFGQFYQEITRMETQEKSNS